MQNSKNTITPRTSGRVRAATLALNEIGNEVQVKFNFDFNKPPRDMDLGPEFEIVMRARDRDQNHPNKADRGMHIVDNAFDVNAPNLRVGLTNNGFRLTKLTHYYRRKDPRQAGYLTIVLHFTRDGESIETDRGIQEILRATAKMTWGYLHVWHNPPECGDNATINFGKALKDAKPEHEYAVKDGKLTLMLSRQQDTQPVEATIAH